MDQVRRLSAVQEHRVLAAEPEIDIDELTALAALVCDAPIAAATLIGDEQQWYLSTFGTSMDALPGDAAFWGDSFLEGNALVVRDTATDPRYAGNPHVLGGPGIRFFAATPLSTLTGIPIGAVCVCDREPRALSARQLDALRAVSRQISAQLALRTRAAVLHANAQWLLEVFRTCPVALAVHRLSDGAFVDVNAAFTALLGWSREEVLGHTALELRLAEDAVARKMQALLDQSGNHHEELAVTTRSGEARHVLAGAALMDIRGEPHVVTTFTDLTNRTRAEERTGAGQDIHP